MSERKQFKTKKDDEVSSSPDPIALYLEEIARYKLLNIEDEIKLGKKIMLGQITFEILKNLPQKDSTNINKVISRNQHKILFSTENTTDQI